MSIEEIARPGIRHTYRDFLDGRVGCEVLNPPPWGPIGEEVYTRTYSRQTPAGKECWAETVRRVVRGNIALSPARLLLHDEAVDLFDLIYNLKAVPAGRHLWVTGTDVPFTRNCFVSGWSPRLSDHFRFLAARLFEGGGVGSNYSADLLATLPDVAGSLSLTISCRADHQDIEAVKVAAGTRFASSITGPATRIVVDDSREGWVDAWSRIIDISTEPGIHRIDLNVSYLRPYGAPLRTFGGQASGPAPFARATLHMADVLNGVDGRITGLDAMRIDHEIAASVVAGGSRRSARMSLMHWQDPLIFDFISCKSDQMEHWTTNISVEVDDAFREALSTGDAHAERVLAAVVAGMVANGEPGLIDTTMHSIGERTAIRTTNPCGEASLEIAPLSGPGADAAGESCNLGSVNLDAFGTDTEAAIGAFWLMARFLYRATMRPYPDAAASRIEGENHRIGVGIMGLQGWAAAHGVPLSGLPESEELLGKLGAFRKACRIAADDLADAAVLPRPIKVTAVAPTGTIAQLSGVTPGIHPVFARHFLRRVRFADTDRALEGLSRSGLRVEDDIYADRTKVVTFPVRDAILDRFPEHLIEQSDEISVSKFFEILAAVQEAFCGGADGQAVSATGQIPPDMDPEELAEAIRGSLGRVKGITVFPTSSRDLAPYEPISAARYEELVAETGGFRGDSNSGECVGACPIR